MIMVLVKEGTFMITVLTFVLILLVGVPLLLYCLCNFVREMALTKDRFVLLPLLRLCIQSK